MLNLTQILKLCFNQLKKTHPRHKRAGDADWLAVCEISLNPRVKDKSWPHRQDILPPLALLPTCMGEKFLWIISDCPYLF